MFFCKKSKFEIICSYVCVIHLLSMVLQLYIDPFKKEKKIKYIISDVYLPDITVPVDWA